MSELSLNSNPPLPGRRRTKKIIAIAVVGLLIAGGATYAYQKVATPQDTAQSMMRVVKVQRGTVTETISASGTVQAPQQIKLNFQGGSSRLTGVYVKVGDHVKAGQVLAQLDDSAAKAQLTSAKANVAAAEAKLAQAGQGSTPEQIAVQQSNVEKARVALEGAKTQYENQLAMYNDRSQANQQVINAQNQIPQTQSQLRSAQAALESAQAKLTAAKQGNATDAALQAAQLGVQSAEMQVTIAEGQLRTAKTPDQVTAANQAVLNAQTQLANAQDKLSSLQAGPDSSTVVQAESAVKQAQAQVDQAKLAADNAEQNLKLAQQNYDNRTQAKSQLDSAKNNVDQAQASYNSAVAQLNQATAPADPTAVQTAQASLDQARAQLDQQQVTLDNLTIKAPIDGVITQVNGNVGELSTSSTPVVEMDNSSESDLQVVAQISQSDIGKIKTGQDAEMTSTSFQNKTFKGKVLTIYPDATTANGVTTYTALLSVDNKEGLLRPGMSTNVTVTVGTHDNVLYIPTEALREQNGKDGVLLAPAGSSSNAKGESRQASGGNSSGTNGTSGAHFQSVEVGLFASDKVEILSGLQEGDSVAIFSGASANQSSQQRQQRGGGFGFGSFGGGGGGGGGIRGGR